MSETDIELRKVFKSFPGNGGPRLVLADINLAIRQGELVSIVGMSGCGKSTLMRLVIGLDQPTSGTVRARGEIVSRPGLDRGVVFQEPRLLPWRTVRGNVALGLANAGLPRDRHDSLVEEHIALVGLGDFAEAYPFQLSGGMAQRVAIARALVNRPEILLLDEPFSALDPMTRAELQDVLLHIRDYEKLTILMITHEVEEAVYLSDRVAVMRPNPGRITSTIDITLPRPRDRDGLEFAVLKRRVGEALRGEPGADHSPVAVLRAAGAITH